MQITQLTMILQSAICLAVLTVLLLKLWPALRLDSFRQQMFSLRDEMFDYAASGKIGFNDPAYRLLRQVMNGFIRYGHRLTFYQIVMNSLEWWISGQQPVLTWATKFEGALQRLEPQTRSDIQAFHDRSLDLVITRLVSGSPVMLLGVMSLGTGLVVHRGWRNLKTAYNQAVSNAVSRVVDTRRLEEEAVAA